MVVSEMGSEASERAGARRACAGGSGASAGRRRRSDEVRALHCAAWHCPRALPGKACEGWPAFSVRGRSSAGQGCHYPREGGAGCRRRTTARGSRRRVARASRRRHARIRSPCALPAGPPFADGSDGSRVLSLFQRRRRSGLAREGCLERELQPAAGGPGGRTTHGQPTDNVARARARRVEEMCRCNSGRSSGARRDPPAPAPAQPDTSFLPYPVVAWPASLSSTPPTPTQP